MSTNNIDNSNKSRGKRHKIFRKEALGLTQIELQEWLEENGIEKSQSSISSYESGVVPSVEILMLYTDHGLNLHWYFTGKGTMIYNNKSMSMISEEGSSYNAIKDSLKLKFSDDPIANLFNSMDKLKQEYIKVLSSESLSNEEKSELKDLVAGKAIEKVNQLKEIR